MAITLDGTNGILSPDFEPSSSTTPTNGLFLPTTNALGFATNSTERLRLDASGNLGLGVTPSGWISTTKALQIGGGLIASIWTTASGAVQLGNNVYTNTSGNDTYTASDYASKYYQLTGKHVWLTAPSGTAGNAISFTQAMTLDANGNLAVGATSAADSAAIATFSGVSTVLLNASGSLLRFNKTAGTDTGWLSNRSYSWHDGNGLALSTQTADPLRFGTNGSERARIDSSGNLLVGTTSASAKVVVYQSSSGVALDISAATTTAATAVGVFTKALNSTATSNVLVQFNINGGAAGSGQINANGANAAAFGTYSDSRLKENITSLPNQLANICALKPSEFDYKDGSGHQIGFIAQEMHEVYPDAIGEGEDGMLTITGWSKTEARLVKAVQELTARLEALENK